MGGLAEVMVVLHLEARPSTHIKRAIKSTRSEVHVKGLVSVVVSVLVLLLHVLATGGAELAAILRYGTSVSAEHPPAAEPLSLLWPLRGEREDRG